MNLIVTCARHLESDTEDELLDILEELGDAEAKVSITDMSGVVTVRTSIDPIRVVREVREKILDEPWSVRYCLRIIPIQKIIGTEIEEMEQTATDLANSQISDDETYRILVEKRNSNMSSQEIITKIAGKIRNKVSLESPDKILLIEILGNVTGVSVLKKDGILSMEKVKRSMSE